MTATKEQLQALLERVETSTGPCSELDAAILSNRGLVRGGVDEIIGYFEWNDLGTGRRYSHPAPVTKSIDAALALVERVLPGQQWTIGQNLHHHYWLCTFNRLDDEGAPYSNASSHAAPTPPLAILSALLKALIAQQEARQ